MAAELSYSITASETKNGVTYSKSWSATPDVSGNTPVSEIKSITTSDTTLDLGGISSIGFVFLKNLDATNYIEVGYTSGTYAIRLKAGESCAFRAGSGMTVIHCLANTGACLLEYLVLPL